MSHPEGFSAMPHIYKLLSPLRKRQNQPVKGPSSMLSADDYSSGPKKSRKKRSIHSGFYQKSRYGYGYGYKVSSALIKSILMLNM